MALGAFISGMAVAESGRGEDIEKTIEPLRSLFSAIFFVSIGMTVDPVVAWRSLPLALTLCTVVIGMHFVSVTVATVLTGSSLRRGVYAGLALGQIGELSFILATIAIAGGVVPEEALPALVTVATITAFTTPLLLGRAQAIVEAIDRWLPDRAQQVLAAYQSFVRRTRIADADQSLRRPAIAVLLDWSALVVLFVVRYTVLPWVDPDVAVVVHVAAVVIAVPFVVGLIRSGLRLLAKIRTLSRGQSGPTPRAKAVETVALLTVVLGVGLPTGTLMRPLVEAPWIEAALLVILLVVLTVLGLRLGSLKGEYTSGVARIALDIASYMRADADEFEPGTPSRSISSPLAGLDYHLMRVRERGPADGRTLAELDLRCRSGATVVAIRRGDTSKTLPTGHEQLRADDILAVSGSPEALGRARAILEGIDPTPA